MQNVKDYFKDYTLYSNSVISFAYQRQHPIEKRVEESTRLKIKHADRLPVICQVISKNKDLFIKQPKFLVYKDQNVGSFLYILRKRIQLRPEEALFIFTEDGHLPNITSTFSEVFNNHMNKDGFLYLAVSMESVFG